MSWILRYLRRGWASQDTWQACMMVGLSKYHAVDCYCMWDKETGGIPVTRNITWLRRMYFPTKDAGHECVCQIEDLNVKICPKLRISQQGRVDYMWIKQ